VSNYGTQHFTRLNLSYISNILAHNVCDRPKSNLYFKHFVDIWLWIIAVQGELEYVWALLWLPQGVDED
jgi:hypothetical protein